MSLQREGLADRAGHSRRTPLTKWSSQYRTCNHRIILGRGDTPIAEGSAARGRRGALAPAPGQGVPQALLEIDERLISPHRLRLADVGLRILDVAGALLLVDRLQLRADNAVHHREELVEGDARAARDVDRLAGGLRRL